MTDTGRETAYLAADTVLLDDGDTDGRIHALLIKRGWEPFKDHWALPGGHVDAGEDTLAAARRELQEETGLPGGEEFLLVGVYAEPGRDPRGRYVSFAYVTWITGLPQPTAADDAVEARWGRSTTCSTVRSRSRSTTNALSATPGRFCSGPARPLLRPTGARCA